MRKALATIVGVLMVAGILAAQGHSNLTEKKVMDEMNIGGALRVGTVIIPPGDYRIVCDRTKITFTRMLDGKRFELPCKGDELKDKAKATKMTTKLDENGVRYLDKLLIAGSTVEHVFN